MSRLHKLFEATPVERWSNVAEEAAHRRERKRLSEIHYNRAQALAAWLLATLVAVNGGALATNLGKVNAVPFVAGIVLAIVSGFASWQEAQDRSGLHYVESLPDASLTAYGRKRSNTWRWRWPALGLAAKWLNWASLSAFIVGCWHSA